MTIPSRLMHYAWVVAAVTFLILLSTAGVRSAPGVLIVPFEEEFHWDRAAISVAVSINLLLYGLMGPFAAALMEWMGVKRTVLISLAIIATGVALTTFMSAPWQLILLWGVVVGGGTGMTALVLAATLVNRWFATHRGVTLGVLTASTATGQLVFLPLMAYLVEHFGWRSAAFLIAGTLATVFPIVAIFLREHPSDIGLAPLGAAVNENENATITKSTSNPAVEAVRALREGMGQRDFWLLAGSFFVCGASTNGLVGTHLIPACMDHGIPEVRAAWLLAMMGIFDLAGTTASGWMSDRLDNRVLLSWYYGLRGLSLVFLPIAFGQAAWGLTLFAIFYGLDWIATVPPTIRLTADCFGRSRAGIMFGWVVAAHQIGAATAAFGAGAIRSWTGHYEKAFLISGGLCLLTAAMVLQIRRQALPIDQPDRELESAPDDAGIRVSQEPAL